LASSSARGSVDLADLQGNVLAGFNKDHLAIVGLTFPGSVAARQWLTSAATFAASHPEVLAFNRLFKAVNARRGSEDGVIEATWVQVLLTGAGLLAIGVPDAEIEHLSPSLRAGMASAARELGDTDESDPSRWVGPFGRPELHAMLVIASDAEVTLRREVSRRQREALQLGIGVAWIEEGHTLPAPLRGHEHFGFKVGISQPAVRGVADEDPSGLGFVPAGEFVCGLPGADRQVRPVPGWASGGSLVAFRRLRQDVAGFRTFLAEQAEALGTDPLKLGAKLVGRGMSGAPLAGVLDSALGITNHRHPNHFDYSSDAQGRVTPRFAHIRKANPRSGNPEGIADTQRRRIIRRGIPYGEPLPTTGATPEQEAADRGLLFFCCQASIEDQFAFIQKSWVSNPNFPGGNHSTHDGASATDGAPDGEDPIVGMHHGHGQDTLKLHWRPDYQMSLTRQFVAVTAGEYFFAPRISQLAAWGQPEAGAAQSTEPVSAARRNSPRSSS
jgi:Dyp-type peroxidase family